MIRRLWPLLLLPLLALVPAACTVSSSADAAMDDQQYLRDVEQWRMQRMARLRAADGWLSYIGSGQLKPGSYSVGSAAGNTLLLPAGPASLGVLQLDKDGQAHIDAPAGTGATLNGQPLRQAALQIGVNGIQGASRIQLGTSEFYLVRMGNVVGWRYRDAGSARRRDFRSIEHFKVDRRWQLQARWEPFAQPRHTVLLTSIGTPLPAQLPGEVVFEVDGQQFRLQPVLDAEAVPSRRLFFLFSDRTSGRETYGGARYLYAAEAKDGKVMLDFNRAENPPCALTPHVVCPIAPAINRLELAVTAGEKFQYLPQ